VHKKLEEELHPVTVRVRTRTREDAWALRYLRLITGLRSLLDCGCVVRSSRLGDQCRVLMLCLRQRELPVFGFVEGRLVMGVIDEVIRRELPALPSRDAAGPSQQAKRSASSNTSSPTKKWASQDEWRRQSARRAATDKSPGKAQPSLASFFGGASAGKDKAAAEGAPPLSQVKRSSQAEKQSQAPAKRFGFYISGTYTHARCIAAC
jgi:exonuclease V